MKWLAALPSTNFRIFVTVCLFSATIQTLLVCVVLQIPLDRYEWIIGMIFAAEGTAMGIDLLQFGKKRDTYMPAPPTAPDVEDVKAGDSPQTKDRTVND